MMNVLKKGSRTGWLILAVLAAGCQNLADEFADAPPEGAREITITMIAKSSENPVFLSARVGAEVAAKNLSEKYSRIDVNVDWRTPIKEDPRAQADRILNAVSDGTDAIIVACSDEDTLTMAINKAVESGVPVMTFDSDVPGSKRFAFYGPDDMKIGETVLTELVGVMGETGEVAVLAGNPNAPNLQKRVLGVQEAAARYPGIRIVGVFFHDEEAGIAAHEVLRVNEAYPNLRGWAMVGGWPLFTEAMLDKIDPEKTKIVAVDALPSQLPYVEQGVVQVLLGQPTFRWGKVSVEKVIEKIYLNEEVPVINEMKLIRISPENLGGWARQLRAWGYTGVPERLLVR